MLFYIVGNLVYYDDYATYTDIYVDYFWPRASQDACLVAYEFLSCAYLQRATYATNHILFRGDPCLPLPI